MHQVKAKIRKNEQLTPSTYLLEIDVPKIASSVRAGQFLHIRINESLDPLLRRPFSIFDLRKKGSAAYVTILYKLAGRGTKILSEMRCGTELDVLGALGKGFGTDNKELKTAPVILAAGGIGIAPLYYLARFLRKQYGPKQRILLFAGMDTKKELVGLDYFKKQKIEVMVSTDDGSRGFKGYVSGLVNKYLSNHKTLTPKPYIYACGPLPMLKAMSGICRKFGIAGQVSVDEMMGCGVGACLGCVIRARDTALSKRIVYKRICKDGPVFDVNEIVWEE